VMESATRIARRFGGDDSGRFVNGVLASIERARMSGELVMGQGVLEPVQVQSDRHEPALLEEMPEVQLPEVAQMEPLEPVLNSPSEPKND
jgi:hypothetical protein